MLKGWFSGAALKLLGCSSLIAGVAAIVAFNMMYHKGVLDERAKWQHKEALLKVQLDTLKRIAGEEVADVRTVYLDRIQTVRLKGQTIIKKVPVYVTKEHDANCTVPTDFVRLWNAANQQTDLSHAAQ
jgi:hypothetical protein